MFCQSQAFQTENNKKENTRFELVLLIFKKSQVRQKSLNFKIWLQKCQIGNSARDQRLHETTIVR